MRVYSYSDNVMVRTNNFDYNSVKFHNDINKLIIYYNKYKNIDKTISYTDYFLKYYNNYIYFKIGTGPKNIKHQINCRTEKHFYDYSFYYDYSKCNSITKFYIMNIIDYFFINSNHYSTYFIFNKIKMYLEYFIYANKTRKLYTYEINYLLPTTKLKKIAIKNKFSKLHSYI